MTSHEIYISCLPQHGDDSGDIYKYICTTIIAIDTGTQKRGVDENKQKFHIFKNESIVRRSSALYTRQRHVLFFFHI